jgi:hypothetical protein
VGVYKGGGRLFPAEGVAPVGVHGTHFSAKDKSNPIIFCNFAHFMCSECFYLVSKIFKI